MIIPSFQTFPLQFTQHIFVLARQVSSKIPSGGQHSHQILKSSHLFSLRYHDDSSLTDPSSHIRPGFTSVVGFYRRQESPSTPWAERQAYYRQFARPTPTGSTGVATLAKTQRYLRYYIFHQYSISISGDKNAKHHTQDPLALSQS